jgi:hypothetical protein
MPSRQLPAPFPGVGDVASEPEEVPPSPLDVEPEDVPDPLPPELPLLPVEDGLVPLLLPLPLLFPVPPLLELPPLLPLPELPVFVLRLLLLLLPVVLPELPLAPFVGVPPEEFMKLFDVPGLCEFELPHPGTRTASNRTAPASCG